MFGKEEIVLLGVFKRGGEVVDMLALFAFQEREPQVRLHSGAQLRRVERLGNIVHPTGLKPR